MVPSDESKTSGVVEGKEEGTVRDAPLAMDGEAFRAVGHRLVDQIAGLLDSVPRRPVTPGESPSAVREALALTGPLPDQGADPAGLLEDTARLLFDHSLFNAHPRFFGYITAAPAPIGILGDFLASALNPERGRLDAVAGGDRDRSADGAVDRRADRLPVRVRGDPGQRRQHGQPGRLLRRARRAGGLERARGRRGAGGRVLRVYASAEVHTWLQKATDLSGLGTSAIRWIPVDADLRMDVAALRAQLEADSVSR